MAQSVSRLDAKLQELARYDISSEDIIGLVGGQKEGSGSYGVVHKVTVRGKPRIAKRLHSIFLNADVSSSEQQGIKERFVNECLLLSKLDHRNVVKFVGVHFNHADHLDVALIMERLYMDLETFLNPSKQPDIDLQTKLLILHDVSSGLLYLHTQLVMPLVHRDLTAANVLLTENFNHAKIADLGVSKLIDNYTQRTHTRTVCPGTLSYMPPEALVENPKYDTPLDVFSFGHLALYVVLQQFPVVYELLHEQVIEAHQSGQVAIFKRRKWLDKLPIDHCLHSLIFQCLRDEPRERPSTRSLNEEMKVKYSEVSSSSTKVT